MVKILQHIKYSVLVINLLLLSITAKAQITDTLAFQDFEITPQAPVWSYTGTPSAFSVGTSPGSATPSNSPIGIGGSRAWNVTQVGSGNPLVFSNQTIPTGYDSIRATFKLAAMNLNGSAGGPDNLDYVLVAYSTNSSSTFTDRIRVRGSSSNNSTWAYSATAVANAYYLPATEVVFQPSTSGLQVTDGYSTVELVFPGSITSLSLRITPRSSSGSDTWLIDNLVLIGESACSSTSSTISPVACNSYTSPSGNSTWTTSNTYTDIIPNAAGCDSIITINLTINATASTINPVVCDSFTSPSGNNTWTTSNTYSDTLTNSVGCDSIITINLTVNANSSTINPTVCGSYTSPSGNNTWTVSNTYLDTIPNANGCDSVITINLTVNTIDTTISITNDTIQANAIGATYQWLDCNNNNSPIAGATNQNFIAITSGSYAVELTQNGCTDTSSCAITTVSIDQLIDKNNIRIYPNPVKDKLTIEFNNNLNNLEFDISTIDGRLVYNNVLNKNKNNIDLSNLIPGIYLINIKSDKYSTHFNFIKD